MVIVKPQARGATWLARTLRLRGTRMLRELGLADGELSVVLVEDRTIRALNRSFCGRDRPTDVLSFTMHGRCRPRCGVLLLGDVVISVDMIRRQARAQRLPMAAVAERLLIHGLLHIIGYDHERSALEARRMRRRERMLAAAIGARRSS